METKKVAIMALAVLLTLSVVGNLYLFTSYNVAQEDITSLEAEAEILNAEITVLESDIDELERSNLVGYLTSAGLGYEYLFFGRWKESVEGIIINYGTKTATKVTVTVRWYANGALLDSETFSVGNIIGKSYIEVSKVYYLDEKPDVHKFELHWE